MLRLLQEASLWGSRKRFSPGRSWRALRQIYGGVCMFWIYEVLWAVSGMDVLYRTILCMRMCFVGGAARD